MSDTALKTLGLAILAGLFANGSVAGEMAKIELRDGITLEAPTGARLEQLAGIDSQVGKIIGPDFECTYDIGRYSDPLTGVEGAALSDTTIDGRAARLMQQGSEVDGVHLGKVASSGLGDVRLTLYCTSQSQAARQDVRAMFQSLRVKG